MTCFDVRSPMSKLDSELKKQKGRERENERERETERERENEKTIKTPKGRNKSYGAEVLMPKRAPLGSRTQSLLFPSSSLLSLSLSFILYSLSPSTSLLFFVHTHLHQNTLAQSSFDTLRTGESEMEKGNSKEGSGCEEERKRACIPSSLPSLLQRGKIESNQNSS